MSAARLEPEYDPGLVEAALLAAIAGHVEEGRFRAARDGLYEIVEPDARDRAFTAFHARWFERLELHRPFVDALDAQPEIASACERWLIARARGAGDETADLRVVAGARPTLLVRVTPETVAAAERLRRLLRHELLHVRDMLDPRFGYDPAMPDGVAGSAWERVVRENYRVLWNVWVDGRLFRLGQAPEDARGRCLGEFTRAFPHLGADAPSHFERYFAARALTHAEILAFAVGGPDGRATLHCPLCALPARALELAQRLPAAVLAAIARDVPAWRPSEGACGRCAELYVSRTAPTG